MLYLNQGKWKTERRNTFDLSYLYIRPRVVHYQKDLFILVIELFSLVDGWTLAQSRLVAVEADCDHRCWHNGSLTKWENRSWSWGDPIVMGAAESWTGLIPTYWFLKSSGLLPAQWQPLYGMVSWEKHDDHTQSRSSHCTIEHDRCLIKTKNFSETTFLPEVQTQRLHTAQKSWLDHGIITRRPERKKTHQQVLLRSMSPQKLTIIWDWWSHSRYIPNNWLAKLCRARRRNLVRILTYPRSFPRPSLAAMAQKGTFRLLSRREQNQTHSPFALCDYSGSLWRKIPCHQRPSNWRRLELCRQQRRQNSLHHWTLSFWLPSEQTAFC